MQFRPVFLVKGIKKTKRESPVTQYTERGGKVDRWRVDIVHGYYPDLSMDLTYETEGDARRGFGEWQVYDPVQIIEALQGERFEVKEIGKVRRHGTPNRYTGVAATSSVWQVSFEGEAGTWMNQYHPVEQRANTYKVGDSLTPLDLFGVLPSVPEDVSDYLDEVAADAREARAEAARLEAERLAAEQRAAELAALEAAAANAAAVAAAQAAALAAQQAAYQAQVNAQNAQANANAAATSAAMALHQQIMQQQAAAGKATGVPGAGQSGFWGY